MQKYILTTLIFFFLALPAITHAGTIIRPVMNSGLVGYWNFQEGAGKTAYDKSGYRNHGALVNMNEEDRVDGRMGQGLEFSGYGSNDEVAVPDKDIFDFGQNNFTVSAWGKKTTNPQQWETMLVNKHNSESDSGTNEWALMMGASTSDSRYPGFGFESGSTYYTALSGDTIENDKWYHVLGMRKGEKIYVYVNGEFKDAVDIGTSAVNDVGRKLRIGSIKNGNYSYEGVIDEVRIYNRALSEEEIERLYKLTRPKIKAPTRDGLAGYWSMDEGMGTQVGDMSGNGNHGQMHNMDPATDWVQGKYGKALDFDGTDDYVEIGNNSSLEPADEISVSLWLKRPDVEQADYAKFVWYGQASSSPWGAYGIEQNMDYEDRMRFHVAVDGSSDDVNSNEGSIIPNKWHHVVGTYDGAKLEIYVDGAWQNTTNNSGSITSYDDTFGLGVGDSYNQTGGYNGQIDEVRIYNRALSESEIQTLYESGRAKLNSSQTDRLTDGLVGMWALDGAAAQGGRAPDGSGSGHTGTIYGATPAIGKVGQALSFDGTDDYVDFGSVHDSVKSVSIYVQPEDTGGGDFFRGKLDEVRFYNRELGQDEVTRLYQMQSGVEPPITAGTLSTNILNLNETAAINILNGAVTPTGFTDPTIYLNGQTGSTTDAEWRHVVVTTPTGVNASSTMSAAWLCGDTVDDIEGNTYGTVDINGQCWMTENMRTTTYPDGSSITKGDTAHGDSDWGTDQAWYSCPPNSSNDHEYGEDCNAADSLGMLYQWSAAMDGSTAEGAQGICPSGWHVATDAEWHSLEDYLKDDGNTCDGSRDGSYDCDPAGSKLAGNDAADENWSSDDLTSHTDFDSSGFNAPPAGNRSTSGGYYNRADSAIFWSSTESGSNAWFRNLYYGHSTVNRNDYFKAYGLSVRCIKN